MKGLFSRHLTRAAALAGNAVCTWRCWKDDSSEPGICTMVVWPFVTSPEGTTPRTSGSSEPPTVLRPLNTNKYEL